MSTQNLESITIVGGGSSGWMSALYLNHLYNRTEKHVDITLIESEHIGPIGVGEATVHSIRFFFQAMGLDENELLAEANATFKTGIMFRNWMKPVAGETHEYFHPFEQQMLSRGYDNATAWFLNQRQAQERYDEGVSVSAHLIKDGHGPKAAQSKSYEGIVPYGYHLDATLLGQFLRKKAVAAGVNHVTATVENVNTDNNKIVSVDTTAGTFSSDIFIDCTGFKGLLIEKLKQDNWVSYEDALPCNKAVAIQIDYPEGQEPKPYTVSTALDNGWAWEIDLVHRRGTGYVYDGNRLTKEQAEQELKDYLGDDASVRKVLHLDMKIGRREEFWIGNCVAIGLSGGFIEPLESTGLHLINSAIRLFGTHCVSKQPDQAVLDSYNRFIRGSYEDLKQFIVLHYCLTNRDDTEFWRQAAQSHEYCPALTRLLPVWKHKICEHLDLAGEFSTIFTDVNYRYVLYGMQHYPNINLGHDENETQQVFQQLAQYAQRAKNFTLPHGEYLAGLKNNA